MKTGESNQQGSFELNGIESSAEESSSNFWGVALITSVFIVVLTALALLLL